MAISKSKKAEYSPVRVGSDPRKDSGDEASKRWLKIEPNSYVDVTILVEADEILSCEQCAIWLEDAQSPVWVYTGPEDPSHDLKIDRRYRAYLPVLVEGDSEPKVWSMGKGAHGSILDIADASGSVKGVEVRIKRTGSGLATRYAVVSKGKRRDVSRIEEVDVLSMLGPVTPDEVKELIAKRLNLETYEDVLARYKGKTPRKVGKKEAPVKGKHASTGRYDTDEEEEELDDIELA